MKVWNDSTIAWLARPGTSPKVWNPIVGCYPVSEGCDNCWVIRQVKHFTCLKKGFWTDDIVNEAGFTGKVKLVEDELMKPILKPPKARGTKTILVCGMGDLMYERIPQDWVNKVIDVIKRSPSDVFLVLTKRPHLLPIRLPNEFIENLWVGVTVEKAKYVDRLKYLRRIKASIKFVVVEPMLDPVSIRDYVDCIDWVICGGESGFYARPMYPRWPEQLLNECLENGIPFFFSGWGRWIPINHHKGFEKDYRNFIYCDFKGNIIRPEFIDGFIDDDSLIGMIKDIREKALDDTLCEREWHQFPIVS